MCVSPFELQPESLDGERVGSATYKYRDINTDEWRRWAHDAYMRGALVNIWIAYTVDCRYRVRMHRDHYVIERWDTPPVGEVGWRKVGKVPRALGHRAACDVMERRAIVARRSLTMSGAAAGMARTDRGAAPVTAPVTAA